MARQDEENRVSDFDYDLFVIGAGSGGVRAARTAAAAGARVAVAEDRYLGGTCVNVGCVPKKLYSYAAHFHDAFDDAAWFRLELPAKPVFDWGTLRDNKTARSSGSTRFMAGCWTTPGSISSMVARVSWMPTASRSVADLQCREDSRGGGRLALGALSSRPRADLTSNEVFDLDQLPKRFLVLGGGYIAVEFASIFNGLGSESHLVYRGELFLRGFDREVREFTREQMAAKGVNLHFETNIERIEKSRGWAGGIAHQR
jgi:glutathione reductase (NADPH)